MRKRSALSSKVRPKQAKPALPAYLLQTWTERAANLLKSLPDWLQGRFASANAEYVRQVSTATGTDARLHVIFNIGSDALYYFASTNDYKNVYERPVVEGKALTPSANRIKADGIIGLENPEDYYFCALSVGGTGMRFYGEYCVALKSTEDASPTNNSKGVQGVLDRNSFDFLVPPLDGLVSGRSLREQQAMAKKLMCDFRSPDMANMLTIKVLQHEGSRPRLLTFGTVGSAVLADEDYVEAYHQGKIDRKSVLEIRSHPEDEMTESSIEDRFTNGEAVTLEEMLWTIRRYRVRETLDAQSIPHRVVTGNGRGRRWR